jgi:hypothetical protein
MADVNLTAPVTDGDTVTAQTLHDMIETATFGNLTGADLSDNATLCVAQASPPSPSEYAYWWDTHEYDPVMRVYSTDHQIWLACGPDRFEYPLQNWSGGAIAKGALAIPAGANKFTIATGPTLNFAGFAQDSAASGAWAPIACCGIGWVAVDPDASFASLEVFTALGAAAGKVRTANWNTASTATNAIALGMAIDGLTNGWTGVSLHGLRAVIWGPKMNTGLL